MSAAWSSGSNHDGKVDGSTLTQASLLRPWIRYFTTIISAWRNLTSNKLKKSEAKFKRKTRKQGQLLCEFGFVLCTAPPSLSRDSRIKRRNQKSWSKQWLENEYCMYRNGSTISQVPTSFYGLSKHDDVVTILFPHKPPKIVSGPRQWSLGCNVFMGAAVSLNPILIILTFETLHNIFLYERAASSTSLIRQILHLWI